MRKFLTIFANFLQEMIIFANSMFCAKLLFYNSFTPENPFLKSTK